jgi:hypothetical protein
MEFFQKILNYLGMMAAILWKLKKWLIPCVALGIAIYFAYMQMYWPAGSIGVASILILFLMKGKKSDDKNGTTNQNPETQKNLAKSFDFNVDAQCQEKDHNKRGMQDGIRVGAYAACVLIIKDSADLRIVIDLVKGIVRAIVAAEFGKRDSDQIFKDLTAIDKAVNDALSGNALLAKYVDKENIFIVIVPDLGKSFNLFNYSARINKLKGIIETEGRAKQIDLIRIEYLKILNDLMGGKIDSEKKTEILGKIMDETRLDGRLPKRAALAQPRKPVSVLPLIALVFALAAGFWLYSWAQHIASAPVIENKVVLTGPDTACIKLRAERYIPPCNLSQPKMQITDKRDDQPVKKKRVYLYTRTFHISPKFTENWTIIDSRNDQGGLCRELISLEDTIAIQTDKRKAEGKKPIEIAPSDLPKQPNIGVIDRYGVIAKGDKYVNATYGYYDPKDEM